MEVTYNPAEDSPLHFIVQIFEWVASVGRGQIRKPLYFNWSSLLTAVDNLGPDQLEYLYNLSGTNTTDQMLAFINISRHRYIIMAQPDLEEFYEVKNLLNLYVPPVILTIGTLGNILSLIVLRSKSMVGVSSYSYLASLAITDTVVLYTGLLRIWLMGLTGEDYTATADWICKLSVLFGYTSSDLSVWLIIAVTVERYIVVCLPFRANRMCNVSRAKKVIGFLFGIILAINLHFLWTVEVVGGETGVQCMAGARFVGLVDVVWPWVDAIIYSFVPFIIIVVLNILISKEVMGAQSKRVMLAATDRNGTSSVNPHQNQADDQRRQQHSSEGTRLTVMLLTVSFTFLLLTLPVNILLIFTYYWNTGHVGAEMSPDEKRRAYQRLARFHLTKAVIDLLMYTNHSINFFLYCATGQKFRRQIISLFKRCMYCRTYTVSGMSFRHSARTSGSMLGVNSEVTTSSRCGRRGSSCVSFDMAECSLRWDCNHSSGEDCHLDGQTEGMITKTAPGYSNNPGFDINTNFYKDGRYGRHTLPKEKNQNVNRLLLSPENNHNSQTHQNYNCPKSHSKKCKHFSKKSKLRAANAPIDSCKPSCKVHFSSRKRTTGPSTSPSNMNPKSYNSLPSDQYKINNKGSPFLSKQ